MDSLTCHKVQDAVSEDERSKGGKSFFVYYASGCGGGSASESQLGIASSTNALFRYIGLSSGTTFSMLIFSFSSNINIGNLSGSFNSGAFLHGISAVYIFDAVCALVAMAFSMTKTATE